MNELITSNLLFDLQAFDRLFSGRDYPAIKHTYPYNYYINEAGASVLEYALAGFKKSEIKVEVKGDSLIVSAKKTPVSSGTATCSGEIVTDGNKWYHQGIAQRCFSASWKLVGIADKKNIKTSFVDGILTIVVPVNKEELFEVSVD